MGRPERRFLLAGIVGLAAVLGVTFFPTTSSSAAIATPTVTSPVMPASTSTASQAAPVDWDSQKAAVPQSANGVINAVDCQTTADCMAVGYATGPSGNQVPLAELWNGSIWKVQQTPVPKNGTDNALTALSCVSATACTAVGSYNDASGEQVTLAEGWDGTHWSLQPDTNPTGGSFDTLTGISCSTPTACTAIGSYTLRDGNELTLAESWNGISWTVQKTNNPGRRFDTFSSVSCTATTACTAVGRLIDTTGAEDTLAELWNGRSWTVAATADAANGTNDFLHGVSCTTATRCTAVGAYTDFAGNQVTLAEVRTGASWTVLPTANPRGTGDSALNQVSCTSVSTCTAVGYANTSTADAPLAESLNGSSWVVQKTIHPSGGTGPDLYGVSCTSGGCTAVGHFTNSMNFGVTLAEARTGNKWAVQKTANIYGAESSSLFGVSCISPTACTAVGARASKSLAEAWNGTSWVVQTTPSVQAASNSVLHGVSCPSPFWCSAVGNYTNSDGESTTLAVTWNGTTWLVQKTPNPVGSHFNSFNAVSCTSVNSCMAVGSSGSGPLAEEWNGTTWSVRKTVAPVGGSDPQLFAVSCTSADACTAVGGYVNVNGQQLSLAETWNGIHWRLQRSVNPVGSPLVNFFGVSCTADATCTAVGAAYNPAIGYQPLAEVSDGGRWRVQTTAVPAHGRSARFSGVSCTSTARCTAVGEYTDSEGEQVTLAEAWTGASWAVQGTDNPVRGQGSGLSAVSCTAEANCLATGSKSNPSELEVPYIEAEQ